MESTSVTGSGWICIHSGNREHGPTAKCSRFSKDGLGRTTHLERRVPLSLGFARNMQIFGKESFTASNRLANCPTLKRGPSHSVFFLSQHLGLLTSSAAKHPEILAIRYQLNLMELARKSWKQGGSTEGKPAPITPTTSREKAEWRVHDCMDKGHFVPTWQCLKPSWWHL